VWDSSTCAARGRESQSDVALYFPQPQGGAFPIKMWPTGTGALTGAALGVVAGTVAAGAAAAAFAALTHGTRNFMRKGFQKGQFAKSEGFVDSKMAGGRHTEIANAWTYHSNV
jgi:hypothetical protein